MRQSLAGVAVAVIPGHVGKARFDPGAVDVADPARGDFLHSVEHDLTMLYAEDLRVALWRMEALAQIVTGEVGATAQESGAADIVVSLHFNSFRAATARGVELWVPGPNSVVAVASRELAQHIYHHLGSGSFPFIGRGVKQAGVNDRARHFVNALTKPGVLAELGFISNVEEEKLIHSAAYRFWCASSIAFGIYHYLREI
jgi:N-acetylmuramoyl-L-alanine amidase